MASLQPYLPCDRSETEQDPARRVLGWGPAKDHLVQAPERLVLAS